MATILDTQLIPDPTQADLYLRLRPGDKSVQVMLHNPAEASSLIFREIPLDPAAATPIAALEEAVYDNPALLSEFRKVTIAYGSPRFLIIPNHFDESLREDSFRAMFPPADDDSNPIEIDMPRAEASLLFDMPKPTLYFLRRTFDNPTITHPITSLVDHFLRENPRPALPKIYANLRQGNADIVVVGDNGTLRYANSLAYRQPIDALYFIMATRRLILPQEPKPEILLCGAQPDRDAVARTLTDNGIDPLTVGCPPAMFKAGRDALMVPFDLLTLPLCV